MAFLSAALTLFLKGRGYLLNIVIAAQLNKNKLEIDCCSKINPDGPHKAIVSVIVLFFVVILKVNSWY